MMKPTMKLRWDRRTVVDPIGNGLANHYVKTVLQQWWEGYQVISGTGLAPEIVGEWRDVEEVEE